MDQSTLTVRCGEWDTQREDLNYLSKDIEVKSLMIHPEFDNETFFNDFAVIVLKGEFDSTRHPHISPMCLATEQDNNDISKVLSSRASFDKF